MSGFPPYAQARGISSINGETGAINFTSSNGSIIITPSGQTIDLEASSTSEVVSLNGLMGALTLASADGISWTPSGGNTLTPVLGNITPAAIVASGNISGTGGSFTSLDVTGDINISSGSAYRYNGVPMIQAQTALSSFFFADSGNLSATGSNNFGFGQFNLVDLTSGSFNIGFGNSALQHVTSGSQNVGIGYDTLGNITTASNNTGLGFNAGGAAYGGGTFPANITGSNSVFVGMNAIPLADGDTNEIVIGYGAVGAGSNTATLGNTSIATTVLQGDVVIGGASPVSPLTVLNNPSGVLQALTLEHTGSGDVGISFQQTGVTAFGLVQRAGAGNGLAFLTQYYQGNAGTELVRILDNGNVGIGVPDPLCLLNISGSSGLAIGGVLTGDNAYTPPPASAMLLGNYQSGFTSYVSPGGGTILGMLNYYSNTTDTFSRNFDIVSFGSTTGAISNVRFIAGNGSTNGEAARINLNGLSTDLGAHFWQFGGYTAGAAVQAGKVAVTINGTTYNLLTA